MDKAKIIRLLDEANDIVSALYRQGANKDYKCKSLREKLNAIGEEINIQPKSNADRIRQMTVEELARFLRNFDMCIVCQVKCSKEYPCNKGIMEWLKKEE
jgi:hypothetical protein